MSTDLDEIRRKRWNEWVEQLEKATRELFDASDAARARTARDLPSGDIAALNNSFGFGGANVAVAFGSR